MNKNQLEFSVIFTNCQTITYYVIISLGIISCPIGYTGIRIKKERNANGKTTTSNISGVDGYIYGVF